MSRTALRSVLWFLGIALTIAASVAPRLSGQSAAGFPSKERGEWAAYNADIKGSRYMPLDQINASNFNKLEVAWRFKTDNLGPRPEYKLEGTPLMVKGTLYMTGGTRRAVVALDAKTGEQKWVYSMDEGRRAEMAPRVLSGRGLSVLDRRQGRRADHLRHDRLSPRAVEREDRPADPDVRQGRHGRSEGRRGLRQAGERQVAAGADSARRGRDRHQLHAAGRRRHDRRAVGDGRRAPLRVHEQRQGPRARLRCADRQAALAVRHDARARRVRPRDVGERILELDRQHRRVDRDVGGSGSRASSTCRSNRRRSTRTAATGRAPASLARASWPSI